MPSTATGQHRDGSRRVPAASDRTDDASSPQPVDSGDPPSVSFAAGTGFDRGPSAESTGPDAARGGHGRVGVGPGLPGAMLFGGRAGLLMMNPFPIVGARIHPPLLRADTLSRERLNGWLDRAATGRVALIVAEAGFGKTTLLGDWARNSERLTAWYRLDPDDRDWLTFTRHLVASGRELDPDFAPATFELLMQLGPGGPSQGDILASLVREFGEFGASHPQGFTLIFDDYHAVDGSDEVVPTVRALVDRTGPGFSIVIASRTTPALPLGRLRARGAVSRIGAETMCFDVAETDRLFRDAYHLPIEPELIDELVQRTEGWAALLSLVRTSAEGQSRDATRLLVRNLTGARGDLHDYLAEEVLDRLPPELASFLVRASILEELDPDAVCVVVDAERPRVLRWIAAAEDISLVSRPDPATCHRYVPLVREFLYARLERSVTPVELRETNIAIAHKFERTNWRLSATHFQRAGKYAEARDVVCNSLESVLGTGQYRAADDLLAGQDGDQVVREVLRSRVLFQMGATKEAIEKASAAVRLAEGTEHRYLSIAAQSAASIAYGARQVELAAQFAQRAVEASSSDEMAELALAYSALIGASVDGSLPALARRLEEMLRAQTARRQVHYAAITSLNLAQCLVWLDRSDDAIRHAETAQQLLKQSSQGYEAVSASLVRAQAYALKGDWHEAELVLRHALDTHHPEGEEEALLEAACLAAWYGPPELALHIVKRASRAAFPASWSLHWRVLDLWLEDRPEIAASIVADLGGEPPPTGEVAAAFRWHLTIARASHRLHDTARLDAALDRTHAVASAQRSPVQRRLAALMQALREGDAASSRVLATWPEHSDPLLGVFAPEFSERIGYLSDLAGAVITRAAVANPVRWRTAIRRATIPSDSHNVERLAPILDQIGEADDITLLRDLGRRYRKSGAAWGDVLVRRLAEPVFFNDLGAVSVYIGDRRIEGHGIRKKVLALFAFLAAQPGGAASPDQILEGLWPDLDPDQGINSVHQTIYFLRRVIDRNYRAGRSADYIHFDDDVVALDRSLVECASWRCRALLSQRPETERQVEELVDQYHGRFAADFAYEDWASAYRENLHAAYLGVVERAVAGSIGSSDLHWRLWVGQRVLAIDPEADVIEAQVIRLYRELGAPAAAAEQYSHYATLIREQLGIDPPPLADL